MMKVYIMAKHALTSSCSFYPLFFILHSHLSVLYFRLLLFSMQCDAVIQAFHLLDGHCALAHTSEHLAGPSQVIPFPHFPYDHELKNSIEPVVHHHCHLPSPAMIVVSVSSWQWMVCNVPHYHQRQHIVQYHFWLPPSVLFWMCNLPNCRSLASWWQVVRTNLETDLIPSFSDLS